ncbi:MULTISPECIES: phosphoribosylformylglycinamidine synthase subunit PurQ [Aminobacterium]|uniref:Phosphoribosylformylglycinamidine synthase subunit PurQ n=1 Tax=Aminobacterium colombiense (strain DSM 12261 / ALA-1) TaxID=572547 RepID=D5EFF5_AMICL|nr:MULTISPECIES: phosphoribosylformylglycinamidine synthase subunit PurQ [Aminobacterium]MDD2378432.1 phosphoribosylformylglycinamidine synthase subunit PurQ [Aminobacterium colombiense]ADE57287.1 phosphoribosylformylglycinamidine synthase I [Aminobacterium colombiense DSM 12261]MDD3767400.1 phosphoribosylformylglycinamidine synthase subunit PurQ [Aminobacterium colombiense]MDD4264895.1 phosphoribosylformylglycinamidine synthase subunit PurQ [Aminobacterium colombiense]MDD4586176.1 phosphoribo
MKACVVVFPGSNCDQDVVYALRHVVQATVETVWHKEKNLPANTDLVVLPGGYSYGDYLRTGAMAARSPIMDAIREYSEKGGLLLGICNGFQILTEAGLLPGVLLANKFLRFICSPCYLKVERNDTPFTLRYSKGQIVQFPIAHHEGLFYLPEEDLKVLEKNNQVVFRYASRDGEIAEQHNPNGALHHIAGITNEKGNILGLMPHPERASELLLGGDDGAVMWQSIKAWIKKEGVR